MVKAKYLHVLWYDDVKFYKGFYNLLQNEQLMPDDHFFVTPYETVYNSLKQYKNVQLVNNIQLFIYLITARWIFAHPLNLRRWQIVLIPRFICKKIIWRTWGHDIRGSKKYNNRIRNIIEKILFSFYKMKVKQLCAIGIAVMGNIDAIQIRRVFDYKPRIFRLAYEGGVYQRAELIKNIDNEIIKKNEVRIMVGHNAGEAEHHIDILNKLEKYKKENIKIIIPCSYSIDKEYLDRVKHKAKDIFSEKVVFIEHFLEYEDYARMIHEIDIAIMDQEYSNGLGNIALIIAFKKKLYVNRFGVVAQDFIDNQIKPNYTDEIGEVTFDEFINNEFDERLCMYSESLTNPCFSVEKWKECLSNIEEL